MLHRSWRRRLPASSKVAFLLAGACAVAAFALVRAEVARGRDAELGPTVRVAAAARDLAPGATLTAADLTTLDLPSSLVPPGAFRDGAEVPVLTTVTPFAAGEVVTAARLARPAGPLTASVPPGMVAFTLAADQGPPGIAVGDRIDVYATYATARPYTAVVADDVAVLGVDRSSSDLGGAGGVGALTVAVDPFTAQELARADATAVLAVAVRGYVPVAITPSVAPTPSGSPMPTSAPSP